MYGNDNMYPSRKSCLDSYKPNPERPPKKELKPFQLPIKGCGEFRCNATNLDKSFEWRCGTPKYCKLFNNATVLKNPDVSYGSERECLNDHETEEQTRARSARGPLLPFYAPDCATWNGDYGRRNDERTMGSPAWCSRYRHTLWQVDSYREPLVGYASEDECLNGRQLPSAEQQVDPEQSPANAKPTPEASCAKFPWLPSRGWNPQCESKWTVDENRCGSASYCRTFDRYPAMWKEPAHKSEADCLAAHQTPFEHPDNSTRHLPWLKDYYVGAQSLARCHYLPMEESECGSRKFCLAQDTQEADRQWRKTYDSAQACFDARQKPESDDWHNW